MLLRTRVTLIVSAVFIVTFGALMGAGVQRERLIERPYARTAIAGTEALWREILAGTVDDLTVVADTVARDGLVAAAARDRNVERLRALATGLVTPLVGNGAVSDVQILDADGRLLYANAGVAEPVRLLDLSTVGAVAEGATPAGVRQVSADAVRVVVARPYGGDGGVPLVLAVARPVDRLLERYAAAIGAEAFLLNTRGRQVAGTDAGRWQALDLALPQRVATVTEARRGDRIDAVTAVPLDDLAAGSAGLLVTVREETASLAAVDRLTLITVAGTLVALAIVLGGLHLYLRASFRPLDRAVAVLGALSRGDTSVDLRRESDDEIGKIAEAVRSLRGSLATFQDTRRQRDLQRRRQERFVRRQMETLAETLESGAREEVLADLKRIVASASDRSDVAAGADPSLRRLIRDDDQLGPLAAVLHQMSGRVVDQHRRLSELVARLREALVRETELASLQQELSIARDLQRSVLPVDFPDRETFAVHCVMESAREVGGDFYDVFDHPDGRVGIVIADVSGKGVPAAFFMAICRTLLKAIALFETEPAVIVRQLNELLSADNDQMMFVTLVFGLFDPVTGRLDYVNAGHNPPYRVGLDGTVAALPPSEDMAAAVVEDLGFTGQRLDLASGDRLVLFTDGVTEAFDPDGAAFGEARLVRVLADAATADPAGMARATVDAVRAFEAGGDPSDDVTLLILARKAGP